MNYTTFRIVFKGFLFKSAINLIVRDLYILTTRSVYEVLTLIQKTVVRTAIMRLCDSTQHSTIPKSRVDDSILTTEKM